MKIATNSSLPAGVPLWSDFTDSPLGEMESVSPLLVDVLPEILFLQVPAWPAPFLFQGHDSNVSSGRFSLAVLSKIASTLLSSSLALFLLSYFSHIHILYFSTLNVLWGQVFYSVLFSIPMLKTGSIWLCLSGRNCRPLYSSVKSTSGSLVSIDRFS